MIRYFSKRLPSGDEIGIQVPPTQLIAFSVTPAKGSEPANFGLCRYPAKVEVDGWRLPTGLQGLVVVELL